MDTKQIDDEIAARIAQLNDRCRTNVMNWRATRGIVSLPPALIRAIWIAVHDFKDFKKSNDPHGEHDFGSFTLAGNEIFWKIDYYNQQLSGWCDPLSPECRRVLTVMLAEEY